VGTFVVCMSCVSQQHLTAGLDWMPALNSL